jgi:hypothetical protein
LVIVPLAPKNSVPLGRVRRSWRLGGKSSTSSGWASAKVALDPAPSPAGRNARPTPCAQHDECEDHCGDHQHLGRISARTERRGMLERRGIAAAMAPSFRRCLLAGKR